MLNIPEVSIWCPYKVRWVKGHVEWGGRVVPHPGIFPPLAEKDIHTVLLKRKQNKVDVFVFKA